ncbi:hypothetical protein M8J77_005445 [Diaphorina citri]|nr:hypothetical protein M8J77_005445 [Diaphorina citri]
MAVCLHVMFVAKSTNIKEDLLDTRKTSVDKSLDFNVPNACTEANEKAISKLTWQSDTHIIQPSSWEEDLNHCYIGWPLSQSNHAGMFACDVCGKEYKYKYGLNRHKNFECGQEPRFQCPQCPHRSKRNSSLKDHMAIRHPT